ncbi:hypothetical protein KSZ_63020 [Dictyobacter formicarum]|uniref:Uncharacterized protein n=1 Tax=Dictyobacter formicarum TaxID=2778368 RepID=A0ABQ3VRF1_9CHLR|nr:hypothetical protein KSZ_63020 [Dictyobacter formicarum]
MESKGEVLLEELSFFLRLRFTTVIVIQIDTSVKIKKKATERNVDNYVDKCSNMWITYNVDKKRRGCQQQPRLFGYF